MCSSNLFSVSMISMEVLHSHSDYFVSAVYVKCSLLPLLKVFSSVHPFSIINFW